MITYLNRYRRVLLMLAIVVMLVTVLAVSAGAVPVNDDPLTLWDWMVRCFTAACGGYVNW